MAVLVNGGILPRGGVASGKVCACSLRSRLVNLDNLFCLRMLLKALRISGITCLVRGGGCEFMATKTSRNSIDKFFLLKHKILLEQNYF